MQKQETLFIEEPVVVAEDFVGKNLTAFMDIKKQRAEVMKHFTQVFWLIFLLVLESISLRLEIQS